MKKTVFQIVVLALFLIMGCSKDEVITDEQESITTITTNSNNAINNNEDEDGCYCNDSIISFFSIPVDDKVFVNDCLPSGRNLLKKGMFNGEILGFGLIDSSISGYEIISCEEAPIDSPPNYGEPLMYKLSANGKLFIGINDYCSITIIGNLYPWGTTGNFIGNATTHDGVGKLKDFTKTFEVYSNYYDEGQLQVTNLVTGKIFLHLSDFNQH